MGIILNEADLKALYADPASMDRLQAMVEDALRAYQRGEVQVQDRFQMPMVEPNRQLRVLTATLPGAGEIVRVNPQYAGATEGHVNMLFDGKSGELLAVVAGRELNVWRTGAPASIACRYLAPARPKILGMPIFDAAATAWAYRWALDHKVGTSIALT
jgi:ornithine cyclodeaminase/alanine dehydrogenase-like protein (mu-crystallin family)